MARRFIHSLRLAQHVILQPVQLAEQPKKPTAIMDLFGISQRREDPANSHVSDQGYLRIPLKKWASEKDPGALL